MHDDIRIRVDVLERCPDGRGLREVKSSTSVKAHHLHDVALQLHVLAGVGMAVRSAEVLHVNNGYMRGAGAVDWPAFFARADVSGDVEAWCGDLPAHLRPHLRPPGSRHDARQHRDRARPVVEPCPA